MIYDLIAEIRLFLVIFIAAFAVMFLTFNATSVITEVGYAVNNDGERVAYFLPVVDVENGIYIPEIKVFAPLIIEKNEDEKALLEALKKGVLLYPGSADPGEAGSTVILGHSSGFLWSGGEYKSVFALLDKLGKDDLIKIYFNNREFVYRVSKSNILSVDKANEAVNYNSGSNMLFLSSCWPIGTSWNRIVVSANLVN